MEHSSVRVVSKHTVQSACSPVPESVASIAFPFPLGPLDHLGSPLIPVGVVWVYESSSTCLEPVPIDTLTSALSRLLDYYPQLTGRLAIDSSNGIRYVHRQETGIHLYEAKCEASFSEFREASAEELSLGPGHVSRISVPLLAPWEASEDSIQREPLLRVQHTRFACGSVAVGVRLARVMAGAGGFLQLYRHLAEIYRAIVHGGKEPMLEHPPQNTPFMAENIGPHHSTDELKAGILPQPPGYSTEPIVKESIKAPDAEGTQTPQTTSPACPVVGREIRFEASELAALKANATPPDGESFVSTFSALSAHIWQRTQIARLRTQTSEQEKGELALQNCTFFTSVDFSSKIGLPRPYFPSAVITPSVQLSMSDLVYAPL
ncbi:hypothetical protein ACHAP5_012051 [Fusarium lateritium]